LRISDAGGENLQAPMPSKRGKCCRSIATGSACGLKSLPAAIRITTNLFAMLGGSRRPLDGTFRVGLPAVR